MTSRAPFRRFREAIDLTPGTLLRSSAWAGPRRIESISGPMIKLVALAVQRYETKTLPRDVVELPGGACAHCGRSIK